MTLKATYEFRTIYSGAGVFSELYEVVKSFRLVRSYTASQTATATASEVGWLVAAVIGRSQEGKRKLLNHMYIIRFGSALLFAAPLDVMFDDIMRWWDLMDTRWGKKKFESSPKTRERRKNFEIYKTDLSIYIKLISSIMQNKLRENIFINLNEECLS